MRAGQPRTTGCCVASLCERRWMDAGMSLTADFSYVSGCRSEEFWRGVTCLLRSGFEIRSRVREKLDCPPQAPPEAKKMGSPLPQAKKMLFVGARMQILAQFQQPSDPDQLTSMGQAASTKWWALHSEHPLTVLRM